MDESRLRPISGIIHDHRPPGTIITGRVFQPIAAEYAFPIVMVRRRLMDLHYGINRHLLLFLGFEREPDWIDRARDLAALLDEVAFTRIAKGNKPVPAKLYREYFWKGPFEGHAVETIESMIHDLQVEKRSQRRNNKDLATIAREVEDFHAQIGAAIEDGQDFKPIVAAL